MFEKFRLQDALVKYKQNFVSTQWGNEKYKWEAVKFFQDKPSLAKNCLIEKLDKLSFSYSATDIQTVNYDAELEVTI